jgi:hypothetical protein
MKIFATSGANGVPSYGGPTTECRLSGYATDRLMGLPLQISTFAHMPSRIPSNLSTQTGNSTGDLIGDHTGDHTGDPIGDHTGDYIGYGPHQEEGVG